MDKIFDWPRVLMNDLPYDFLLEVVFRVVVMFILLLGFLRFTGKRGVKQLSIFEMVFIIALGSAIGDPMLYDNVGLLPGIAVLIITILLYRIVTFLSSKFKPVEHFLEGRTTCIIEEGEFLLSHLKKEHMARNEFFSELRLQQIEHLGQIKLAYLETTGDISIFMKPDDEVIYGLPIVPKLYDQKSTNIKYKGMNSCTFCGHTQNIEQSFAVCERCGKKEWVKSINHKRIS